MYASYNTYLHFHIFAFLHSKRVLQHMLIGYLDMSHNHLDLCNCFHRGCYSDNISTFLRYIDREDCLLCNFPHLIHKSNHLGKDFHIYHLCIPKLYYSLCNNILVDCYLNNNTKNHIFFHESVHN